MQKYIKTAAGEFVLFSEKLMHSDVAEQLRLRPVSAGFVFRRPDGVPLCLGESTSLGLASLHEDTDHLWEWLS